jgi:hypothetical protein
LCCFASLKKTHNEPENKKQKNKKQTKPRNPKNKKKRVRPTGGSLGTPSSTSTRSFHLRANTSDTRHLRGTSEPQWRACHLPGPLQQGVMVNDKRTHTHPKYFFHTLLIFKDGLILSSMMVNIPRFNTFNHKSTETPLLVNTSPNI